MEDLTARARIRDAAMAQFAEHGFDRATIKGIAAAAGVSTGLVQHHFKTKERLREACDEVAVRILTEQVAVLDHVDEEVRRPGFAAALYAKSPLLVRYVIRAFLEGTPAAATLFDLMVSATERFLSATDPDRFPPGSARARDGATLMGAMHLGPAILHEQVSRRTGVHVLDESAAPQLGLVILDLYTVMARWIDSDTGQQARAAVAAYLDDVVAAPPDRAPSGDGEGASQEGEAHG